MKVLITGISGFVGKHFLEYLKQNFNQNLKIYGLIRSKNKINNIIKFSENIEIIVCDLLKEKRIFNIINKIKPDKIFHLAAESSVAGSWNSPVSIFNNNIIGQCNLLEAVRRVVTQKYNPIIHIACSSEEYGLINLSDIPVNENCPLRPLSPYAVSKISQDFMGFQYLKSYGLRIIRTRAFNHSGP